MTAQEKKTNIVLIGMPGAGKSTLGVLLAKTLGMQFIDTDLSIQQSEGRLLQEIINQDGIRRFMEIEEAVICALKAYNTVIATGGSVVYSHSAMQALGQNGRVVYLHVSFAEIEKRITNIQSRGIVLKHDAGLQAMYDERVPLYRAYSDITVDCSGSGDIEGCVTKLAETLRQ